jgi:hypothetical protein
VSDKERFLCSTQPEIEESRSLIAATTLGGNDPTTKSEGGWATRFLVNAQGTCDLGCGGGESQAVVDQQRDDALTRGWEQRRPGIQRRERGPSQICCLVEKVQGAGGQRLRLDLEGSVAIVGVDEAHTVQDLCCRCRSMRASRLRGGAGDGACSSRSGRSVTRLADGGGEAVLEVSEEDG